MAPSPASPPPDAPVSRLAYSIAVPAGAVALLGLMTLVWVFGPRAVYFGVFSVLGVEAFRFPFLDLHAILAAAECHRLGIDIYLPMPCDVLHRPHVYSPLWIPLTPAYLGTRDTFWLGLLLDGFFLLSLGLAMRPRSVREIAIFALAVISPMTVYALERANNDIVIFLLVLGGAALYALPRPHRLGSYALFLLAGLLKFYPMVLLALIGRERGRGILLPAAMIGSALLLFGLAEGADLGRALANVPSPTYFGATFSALNLPFGLASMMPGLPIFPRRLFGAVLLAALVASVIVRTLRTARLLDDSIEATERETALLAAGGLMLMACFFVGQNIDYRGIYFLLVLPGLVRLRRSADGSGTRQFASAMIAAVLFVMWSDFLRHGVHNLGDLLGLDGWLLNAVEPLLWLSRELTWWWLVAGLAAIVLAQLRRLPLARGALAHLRRLVPAFGA